MDFIRSCDECGGDRCGTVARFRFEFVENKGTFRTRVGKSSRPKEVFPARGRSKGRRRSNRAGFDSPLLSGAGPVRPLTEPF